MKQQSLLHGCSIRLTPWFGFPTSVEIHIQIIYEKDLALQRSYVFKTSGSTSKLSCTMYRGEQNPEIWHIRASFLNTSKHTLQICNFALQFVCHSLLNLLDQNPQNKAFPLKYTLSFSLCNSEKSMESHWCCNDCPCNL